jgi:hypothetical protein
MSLAAHVPLAGGRALMAFACAWDRELSRPRRLALLVSLLFLLGSRSSLWADDWKYDVVVLKDNQKVLQGLLVDYDENSSVIEIRVVIRRPGERTRVETYLFDRNQVGSVERLDDQERARLEARLKALDISGKELAERLRKLKLQPISWNHLRHSSAFRFREAHFTLESNVKEDLFRRVAVRLSQVYAAYTRFLPPRNKPGRPTTILLAGSLVDYQALLKERGYQFINPGFYDPTNNQLVCGSNLEHLGTQLEQTHKDHQKLRNAIKVRQEELAKLYRGKIPRELTRALADDQRKIDQADTANDKLFQEATRLLFQRLYHEAFHAYLGSSVYAPAREELPRWLNEGLAQIFETALFEGDELRIGHADPERLKRAQDALAANELVSLLNLLCSTPKQFIVASARDQLTSDRYYLTAWALASFLAFECKVLRPEALDTYARATHLQVHPVEAFCQLAAVDVKRLPDFEKQFRSYLQHLRPSGTTGQQR